MRQPAGGKPSARTPITPAPVPPMTPEHILAAITAAHERTTATAESLVAAQRG